MPEAVFFNQDKEALSQINQGLHSIDNNDSLKNLLDQILSICEEIGARAINASDEDNNYKVSIEIDQETNPPEVRFYIHQKLKIKFGQFFEAMANRKGTTDVLTLTRTGYGTTAPETQPEKKNGTNPHDRHLVEYAMSSFSNIHNFLKKFRKILGS